MASPTKVCGRIKNSFKDAEFVYKNGSCFELYRILKEIFPQAIAWTNIDHVWTEINGEWYDIDGKRKEKSEGLIKMKEHGMCESACLWKNNTTWRVDEAKKEYN